MLIPQHVQNMATRIQIELEKQIQNDFNTVESKYCLEQIKNIHEQMLNQKGNLFESDDDYINMLAIMTAILKSSTALYYPGLDIVYKEVSIEPELSFALNHASITHPRMSKELSIVINFLQNPSISSWSQDDEFIDFKVFKLVKTKNEWNGLMKELSGTDLAPDFKHLKIGYVEVETTSFFPKGIALKAKDHLISKLGKEGFDAKRKAFKKWFKIGATGTYYIYVPR